MRRFRRLIFVRALLLVIALTGLAYLLFKAQYAYAALSAPFCIWLLTLNFRSQLRAYRELEEFAEAARYRDFTRHFPLSRTQAELLPLRSAFNEINGVFKKISGERETQYQYLHQLLEIVDTAILSYNTETQEVMWMNEAFKKLFAIPYLHRFEGLQRKNEDLYQKTMHLVAGERTLLSVNSAKGHIKLLLTASHFQTPEGKFRLIVYQNVNEAIDETEAKAWQKLLSVLTHEIMNSIAPISSLADTLKSRLDALPNNEELEDIRLGTETIKRRSDGLLKFADTYRSLNKVERPNLGTVRAADLFENLYQLMEPSVIQKNIELDIILKNTQLVLELDISLIEQVLINLLLNAMEAVKDVAEPHIALSASVVDGKPRIQVSDNGKGIPADLLENIFIPFFTTRKSGSGVGLTLSKQIMLLHGGNILVRSEKGKGSTFTLQF